MSEQIRNLTRETDPIKKIQIELFWKYQTEMKNVIRGPQQKI